MFIVMAKEGVVHAKRVKSAQKKKNQTTLLANAVNMNVPIVVVLIVMCVTMLVPHAVAVLCVPNVNAVALIHAKGLERVLVIATAVITMVAWMAKSCML